MGSSNKNIGTEGLTGTVANFVFRHRKEDGKTIVSHAPGKRTGEPTDVQLEHQEKFQRAVIYGKAQMADPAKKAAYKEKAKSGESAYNVAVADYFNAPHIEDVDLSAYTGLLGSTITVRAVDDFKVIKLHVHIADSNGTKVEEGNAVQVDTDPLLWVYTATASNPSLIGDKIQVTAWDNPGNKGIKDVVL